MPKSSRSRSPILRPWHGLRRWLKRIDRQSATRRGGPWTRATEYALVLALPASIVLALVLDEIGVSQRAEPIARVRLGLERTGGPLVGRSIPVDTERIPWSMTLPVAEVLVERRTFEHGWPFAGRTVETPPIAMASVLLAPDERIDLADASEVDRVGRLAGVDLGRAREVVIETLRADPRRNEIAAGLEDGRPVEVRSWSSTIALLGILWILIFVVSSLVIRVLQFTAWLAANDRRRRTVKRLRNGQCPGCRYDLRAERFPKRCPECGLRIWA